LGAYLRDNYLDRGKQSLRENLAKVIVKGVLQAPEGNELISDRLTEAAHVLGDVAPALLRQGLQQVITNRFQSAGISEEGQLRLIGRVGDMTAVWDAIPATAKPGLVAAIGRRSIEDLTSDGILSTMQAYTEAAYAVEARLMNLPPLTNALRDIIRRLPSPHLWPHALRRFAESPGWRWAEENMRGLILPFAQHMKAQHIRQIADATLTNSQIREAANIPALMEHLFTLVPLDPDVLTEWEYFINKLVEAEDGDVTEYYANPGLQARIAAEKSA
jgi:hypothetical protein